MESHYITQAFILMAEWGGMDPEEKQSILEHPENNDMVNGKIIIL